jgi:hypothetical protein
MLTEPTRHFSFELELVSVGRLKGLIKNLVQSLDGRKLLRDGGAIAIGYYIPEPSCML